jgi:hypothetical protein
VLFINIFVEGLYNSGCNIVYKSRWIDGGCAGAAHHRQSGHTAAILQQLAQTAKVRYVKKNVLWDERGAGSSMPTSNANSDVSSNESKPQHAQQPATVVANGTNRNAE